MSSVQSAILSKWRGYWCYRNRSAFQEHDSRRRPRLLTDVSVIMRHDARTGIQRVVRAVWTNLRERSGETFDAVPVFATRTHGYRFAPPDFLTCTPNERLAGETVSVQPGDKFLGLDLSAHLLPAYERQIRSWRAHGATTHLVVYDLLPLQKPQWFNENTTRNFLRWIEMVRRHCDQALCISDEVANTLRAHLRVEVPEPAIGRIQLTGDIAGSSPSRGTDGRVSSFIERARRTPSILMVGTIEPRKGYDLALAAFEHLWKQSDGEAPMLVIAGQPGWRTTALQKRIREHAEHGRRLHWFGEVSDEALTQLYQACSALFLASSGEGFGLPATEAAQHRRWALVRDLPVFREQRLPNLRYFTSDAPEDLAQALRELFQTAEAAPPPAAQLPSWSWCVDRLLDEIGFVNSPSAPHTTSCNH